MVAVRWPPARSCVFPTLVYLTLPCVRHRAKVGILRSLRFLSGREQGRRWETKSGRERGLEIRQRGLVPPFPRHRTPEGAERDEAFEGKQDGPAASAAGRLGWLGPGFPASLQEGDEPWAGSSGAQTQGASNCWKRPCARRAQKQLLPTGASAGPLPVLCMNRGTKRFEGPRPGPGLVGKEARGQTARQHSPPCQTHLSLKGGGRRAPFLPGRFVDANSRARAFKRLVRDRTEAGGPRRVWGRAVPLRVCTSLPTPPHGTLQCSGNGKPHGIWE